MKRVILLAVVFLSGCVTTPRTYEQQQMDYMQMQQTLQIMNSMQPRTAPQQSPAMMQGFLQQNTQNGAVRYCKYSNGVITTISSVNLCPLSNP